MPSANLRVLVPPIGGRPSPHGLLSGCIDVEQVSDVHQLNGTDMLSPTCAPANPWQDCPTAEAGQFPWTNPASKVFDRFATCTFEPVTAYAGVECSVLGVPYAESADFAEARLRLGEQFVLEEWFMRRFLANANHTTDLTPGGGALHIVNGIGVLETWLAENYGGEGIIHAPIGTGSLLAMHHQTDFPTDEGCLETLAGNTIVLGAGYSVNVGPATPPDPVPVAPTGEAWLYITPPMRIRRDEPQLVQRDEWMGVNTSLNDRRTTFETTFVPEVACCIAAAVRVTLSACC